MYHIRSCCTYLSTSPPCSIPTLSLHCTCNMLVNLSLQFAAKQMDRSAKKCEKDEKTEKTKLKKVSCVENLSQSHNVIVIDTPTC